MTTTELITPPRASSPPEPGSDADRNAHPAASANPTFGEMLAEVVPLIGAIPVYGPPVVLLAGPWVLLALMLAGPFALVVTLVVVLAAAAAVVALIGAILATPYLVVRQLRAYWARHVSMRAPAPRLVTGGSRWDAA